MTAFFAFNSTSCSSDHCQSSDQFNTWNMWSLNQLPFGVKYCAYFIWLFLSSGFEYWSFWMTKIVFFLPSVAFLQWNNISIFHQLFKYATSRNMCDITVITDLFLVRKWIYLLRFKTGSLFSCLMVIMNHNWRKKWKKKRIKIKQF